MAYKIQRSDLDIIKVIYSGSVDINERKMAVDEVCKSIEKLDDVRLLIDVRNITSMSMSIPQQEEFAKYLSDREELAKAKVAVIHNGKGNPNFMINTFAYGKGYDTVSFNNEYEAALWLLGEIK